MKCYFLFLSWLSAGFVLTAFDSGHRQGVIVKLQARSQARLIARTESDSGYHQSSNHLRSSRSDSPERTRGGLSRQQNSTPRPDRSQPFEAERSPSPGPRQRPPLFRTPGQKNLNVPARTASTSADGTASSPLPLSVVGGGSNRRYSNTPSPSSNSPSTPPRRASPRTPVEAHALVSGTGSVWSSSPRKYGGLTSQATIADTYKPTMKSAKDLDRAKAGSVTRGRTSKATASATGPQVTAKLSRDANGSTLGSGTIEFSAGKSFTQIHKVGLGEKIERKMTASDILDGKNRPFREVSVTTHLKGAGSCSVSACHEDSLETPPSGDKRKSAASRTPVSLWNDI